jgi:hypothetical protein
MNTFRLVALALMLAACGGAAVDSSDLAESDTTEPAASPSAPSDPSPGTRGDVEPSPEYSDDAEPVEAQPDPVVVDPTLPDPRRASPEPAATPDPGPTRYLPPFTVEPTPSPMDGDDAPEAQPEPAVEAESDLFENGTACDADELCASGECSPVHRANVATTEGYCVAAPEDGTTHYCTWMNGSCVALDRR